MSDNSLSGNWVGFYKYDPEVEPVRTTKYKFKMKIKVDDDDVSGEITDIVENGQQPGTATVDGFIIGEEISFIKQYPSLVIRDENDNITIDESQSHPEIHYHGEISENKISGTWEVEHGVKMIAGTYYPIMATGTWQLEKVD